MEFTTARIAQINILNVQDGLEQRYIRLKNHLKIVNADVVCLEEVINNEMLEHYLRSIGYNFFYHADAFVRQDEMSGDHTSIASKFPIMDSFDLCFGDLSPNTRNTSVAKIAFPTRPGFVSASHFAWGEGAEGVRLRQAERITAAAANLVGNSRSSFFLLAGDLNAEEDSRSIRYLHGKDLASDGQSSTYWTDAYLLKNDPSVRITSDHSQGTLGPATASKYGIIETRLLPARRIDYILTYGWSYGMLGCANDFGRFGDPLSKNELELSDHWGLWADILI